MPKSFRIRTQLFDSNGAIISNSFNEYYCREIYISALSSRLYERHDIIDRSRTELDVTRYGSRVAPFLGELAETLSVSITLGQLARTPGIFGDTLNQDVVIEGRPFALAATYWMIAIYRICAFAPVDATNITELLAKSPNYHDVWDRTVDRKSAINAWKRAQTRSSRYPLGYSPTDREMLHYNCGVVEFYCQRKTAYRKVLHDSGYVY